MAFAISRSRLRTPASRVYCSMIVLSASSGRRICASVRPCSAICLGTRWRLRDLELLLARVARDLEDLHAVEQRRRDRVEHVRRRDEDDVRQIELHLEVVIRERRVLLGVEHLEQRGRRVAAEVGAELVDLVEHEHRVLGADPAHALDDAARERADVRAAVAADLGLVAHAAERDADELAPERARDRLAERRLADARRPGQAEDRPLLPRRELAHRQVLEDALLHLLQIVVVGVEDLRAPCRDPGDPRSASTTAARRATRGRCAARCTRPTTAPSA